MGIAVDIVVGTAGGIGIDIESAGPGETEDQICVSLIRSLDFMSGVHETLFSFCSKEQDREAGPSLFCSTEQNKEAVASLFCSKQQKEKLEFLCCSSKQKNRDVGFAQKTKQEKLQHVVVPLSQQGKATALFCLF